MKTQDGWVAIHTIDIEVVRNAEGKYNAVAEIFHRKTDDFDIEPKTDRIVATPADGKRSTAVRLLRTKLDELLQGLEGDA